MSVEQEFNFKYPQLLYIEHKYLENNQIGISYLYLRNAIVYGSVRIFNIKDGKIQWDAPVGTFKTWTDVKQRER